MITFIKPHAHYNECNACERIVQSPLQNLPYNLYWVLHSIRKMPICHRYYFKNAMRMGCCW